MADLDTLKNVTRALRRIRSAGGRSETDRLHRAVSVPPERASQGLERVRQILAAGFRAKDPEAVQALEEVSRLIGATPPAPPETTTASEPETEEKAEGDGEEDPEPTRRARRSRDRLERSAPDRGES